MKQNRWIWILGILILGMSVQTCGRKKGPTKEKVERVVPVRVGFADSGTVVKTLPIPAILKARPQTPVMPDVPGKFVEFTVKEGERVRKDQVIAYLDRSLPGVPYAPAEVRAPVAGRVHLTVLDPGSRVSPERPLAFILGDEYEAVVDAPERYAGHVRTGDRTFALVQGDTLWGTVAWVGRMIDPRTRTFQVRVRFRQGAAVTPGQSVEVWLPVAHAEGLRLPRQVVMLYPEPHVFLVQNGRAHKRRVQVGLRGDRYIEILDGLTPGDSVIVVGNRVVREGDRVKVEQTS